MGDTTPRPSPPVYRDQLITVDGLSANDIRRHVRSGDLVRVARGAYTPGVDLAGLSPEARHCARLPAVHAAQATPTVVSHFSAALWHGLPLWGVDLRRVHLSKLDPRATGRRSSGLWVHEARLESEEMTVVDGLPVTSVARTVVDTVLTAPIEVGIGVLDAALRARLVTRDELIAAQAAAVGRHGRARVDAAFPFSDGRSESPGESWSRLLFARAGLPEPELQVEFHRVNGTLIARVDFYWRKFRLIGEFDGLVKYQKFIPPGMTVSDVVVAERVRERELIGQGDDVLRWVWADLNSPTRLIAELRGALSPHRGTFPKLGEFPDGRPWGR